MTSVVNSSAMGESFLHSNITITSNSEMVEIVIDLKRIGGYEYDFLDTISNKYTCLICTNIQREPTIVSCCGQHFCCSCLDKWFAINKKCPHCTVDEFQYFTNKQQVREINELRVRCCNSDRGCNWTGKLEELKSHKNRDCLRAKINCPNGCGANVERWKLMEHKKCCTPLKTSQFLRAEN